LFKSGYINGLVDTETFQRMTQVQSLKASRIVSNRDPIKMDAVKILVEHCEIQANAMGLRDAAMISVMASCGVRRAELVTIKLEDYDREKKTFTVIGKGNKERLVPIPAATLKRIENWIVSSRSDVPGFLFCRVRRHDKVVISDTEYLSGNGVYDMLEKRTLELKHAHIRPHGLRRFCGTTLLKSGMTLCLFVIILAMKVFQRHRFILRKMKMSYMRPQEAVTNFV
jgi:integrase/recombinase XerD